MYRRLMREKIPPSLLVSYAPDKDVDAAPRLVRALLATSVTILRSARSKGGTMACTEHRSRAEATCKRIYHRFFSSRGHLKAHACVIPDPAFPPVFFDFHSHNLLGIRDPRQSFLSL